MTTGARLRRLKIDRYRNVTPGTELVFNEGFNVLLGRNGTGKTTLLNLIAMVAKCDFSALKDTELALDYELYYAGMRVEVSVQSTRQGGEAAALLAPALGQPAAIPGLQHGDPLPARWSYTIALHLAGEQRRHEIVANALGARLRTIGAETTEIPIPVVALFESDFFPAAMRLMAQHLGAQNHDLIIATIIRMVVSSNGGRFDEALSTIKSMNDGLRSTEPGSIQGSFLLFERKSEQGGLSFGGFNFAPWELLTYLMGTEPHLVGRESLTIPHTKLSFLQKAVALLGFERADLILRLVSKDVENGTEQFLYSNLGFSFTLEDGSIISHELLSYGQKRLLSFLYYAAANPDIVIADELVNGLHHDWIEACLEVIRDRQSFLTSQNPVLLDFLPFQSAEEVQRTFLLCRREVRDGRVQMVWQNLSPESADSFFRSYKTEALQVSEILRARGLW